MNFVGQKEYNICVYLKTNTNAKVLLYFLNKNELNINNFD